MKSQITLFALPGKCPLRGASGWAGSIDRGLAGPARAPSWSSRENSARRPQPEPVSFRNSRRDLKRRCGCAIRCGRRSIVIALLLGIDAQFPQASGKPFCAGALLTRRLFLLLGTLRFLLGTLVRGTRQ